MSDQATKFVRATAVRFPELHDLLDEHTKDNRGEILPHVFLGELTRYLLSVLSRSNTGADLQVRRQLRQILDHLETAFASGDAELQELISTSFLENLPRPGEEGGQIRDLLGPRLKKEARVIG
jgi:hypothetical protein